MIALYEPDVVIDGGRARLVRGLDAILEFFENLIVSGRKLDLGTQQLPLISGDLALSSSLSASGNTTAEIARRQTDGSWRWVVDQFSIAYFSEPADQNQC